MNENEVRRQLQNMVAFIQQEGSEKCDEIRSKAKEDFAIEKARLVQAGKRKIQKEYDAKEKSVEVQRKIAYSNELNQSRLSVLRAREEVVQEILTEALNEMAKIGDPASPKYKTLLHDLLVQALCKLAEEDIVVVCRKSDIDLVNAVLPDAIQKARKLANMPTLNATLTKKFNLAPARSADNKGDACSGGVLLSAKAGKVTCNQTLDARLSLAYQSRLPEIRELLFGKNPNRKFDD